MNARVAEMYLPADMTYEKIFDATVTVPVVPAQDEPEIEGLTTIAGCERIWI